MNRGVASLWGIATASSCYSSGDLGIGSWICCTDCEWMWHRCPHSITAIKPWHLLLGSAEPVPEKGVSQPQGGAWSREWEGSFGWEGVGFDLKTFLFQVLSWLSSFGTLADLTSILKDSPVFKTSLFSLTKTVTLGFHLVSNSDCFVYS